MADPTLVQEALMLQSQGKLQDAARVYQVLLTAEPENPDLLVMFAGVLIEAKNTESAIQLIGHAIVLAPERREFYRALASAHAAAGQADQAAAIHAELATAAHQDGLLEAAEEDYAAALQYDPENPHLINNRGAALKRLGRLEEALAAFDRALELEPALHSALSNRATIHWENGDAGAAFRDHRAAIALMPDDAQLRLNLAVALRETGEAEAALAEYDRAVALSPDFALAQHDRGQLLAQMGRLEEGFTGLEWRWSPAYNYKEKPRGYKQPVWRGEPAAEVKGKLLVISEQGYGDTIQFSRYVPLLVERGYDVLLEVQPPLLRLYGEGFARPNIRVVERRAAAGPTGLRKLLDVGKMPDFAAYVGLLSLPERLKTTLDTIPAQTPYLTVRDAHVTKWAETMKPAPGKKKIGLVWQGDPKHRQDKTRSIPPALLHALVTRSDAQFYALQKGPGAEWEFPEGTVTKLGDGLTDFCDTAAVIRNLDLVISVDTAVAHLAGALDCPAWIMLTKVGEWRWLTGTNTSPWYPKARLFRQETQGEWDEVIDRIGAALTAFV